MTTMHLLYMALSALVGSWLVFTIWTLRRPPAHLVRPVLAFVCQLTDDPEITCFFCGQAAVDEEFTYRTHDRMVTAGLHRACRLNPRHLNLAAVELRNLVR